MLFFNNIYLNIILDEFEFDSTEKLTEVDELAYRKFRILYGICQVLDFIINFYIWKFKLQGEEVKDIIPFQANFDLLKSISLDKGSLMKNK